MTTLFTPLQLRGLEIPNRAWMSPMCTYSADASPATAGRPTDFHLAHYSARAAGGAGLVMVEATGVAAEGRISPFDLGLWEDAQVPDFTRIASAIRAQGAVAGVQLAHAGRKASTGRPWEGGDWLGADEYGWMPYGASPVAFPGGPVPHEMSREDLTAVVASVCVGISFVGNLLEEQRERQQQQQNSAIGIGIVHQPAGDPRSQASPWFPHRPLGD